MEKDKIQMRINGLHSGTILRERSLGNGLVEQWHEHPETREVIVVHTWAVEDGDCISKESQVMQVYPRQKGLVDCILGLEAVFKTIEQM